MSFSKKYTDLNNPENSLYLTWESGFSNLKVYHQGKLVEIVKDPSALVLGVSIDHPELTTIEITFTDNKSTDLRVRVNGMPYLPEKIATDSHSVNAVVIAFWTLFGFGIIGFGFSYVALQDLIEYPQIKLVLGIDAGFVISYAVAAVFMRKGQKWAYFLGTGMFVLTTLLFVWNTSVGFGFGFGMLAIIILLVRIVFIVYLLRYAKDIMLIERKRTEADKTEVLDDF
ncbi:MAG: hypothetical protein QNK23_10665 [Crocinitomicaceae bacterium]|nr:hypothetical protein [Crocinitomicaceae bacterium]